MEREGAYLPEPVVELILIRLARPDVRRAGAVCRTWQAFIRSPCFARARRAVAEENAWRGRSVALCSPHACMVPSMWVYDELLEEWFDFSLDFCPEGPPAPRHLFHHCSGKHFVGSAAGFLFMDLRHEMDYSCFDASFYTPARLNSGETFVGDPFQRTLDRVPKLTTLGPHVHVVARGFFGDKASHAYSVLLIDSTSQIHVFNSYSGSWSLASMGISAFPATDDVPSGFDFWRRNTNGGVVVLRKGTLIFCTGTRIQRAAYAQMKRTHRYGKLKQNGIFVLNLQHPESHRCWMRIDLPKNADQFFYRLLDCNDRLLLVGGRFQSVTFSYINIWELDLRSYSWIFMESMPYKWVQQLQYIYPYVNILSFGVRDQVCFLSLRTDARVLIYHLCKRSWMWLPSIPNFPGKDWPGNGVKCSGAVGNYFDGFEL